MSAPDNRLAFPHVFLKGMMGTVIHHGGKTSPQAQYCLLIADAVIQVEHHRDLCIISKPLYCVGQMPELPGIDSTLPDREDQWAILRLAGFHENLRSLKIVNIESGNGRSGILRDLQDFFQCCKHIIAPFRRRHTGLRLNFSPKLSFYF